MTKSTIIVLEGPEASGKTSTLKELMSRLRKITNKNIIHMREPGSSKKSEEIRKKILSSPDLSVEERMKLYSESRKCMVQNAKRTFENENNIVLMDRSFVSTFVYQGFAENPRVSFESIKKENLENFKTLSIDHLFLLTGDLDVLQKRINSRDEKDLNFFDLKEREFHELTYEGYRMFEKGGYFNRKTNDIIKNTTTIDTTEININTAVEIIINELKGSNLI